MFQFDNRYLPVFYCIRGNMTLKICLGLDSSLLVEILACQFFFLKKRTLDKDYAGKTCHRKVMSVALNNFDVTFLPGLTTCYNYLTGQKMFRFGAT